MGKVHFGVHVTYTLYSFVWWLPDIMQKMKVIASVMKFQVKKKTLINVVPKIISMLSMYVSLENSMKTYFGAWLWRGRCRIRLLHVRLLKIRRMLLFHIKWLLNTLFLTFCGFHKENKLCTLQHFDKKLWQGSKEKLIKVLNWNKNQSALQRFILLDKKGIHETRKWNKN